MAQYYMKCIYGNIIIVECLIWYQEEYVIEYHEYSVNNMYIEYQRVVYYNGSNI